MASKNGSTKELNLIAEGTSIEGKIKSQGSVRVDGCVIGELNAQESVVIGATGEINGDIAARNVTVGGKIQGSVLAQEKLYFQSQAVMRGNIQAARLVVDEGAIFEGNCSMKSGSATSASTGTVRPLDSLDNEENNKR